MKCRRLPDARYDEKNIHFVSNSGVTANVWAFIGSFGKGELFLANNTSNAKAGFDNTSYLNLLETAAIPSIKEKISEFIFMQDNSSVHTKYNKVTKRRLVDEFFEREGLVLLKPWPARSPDLNPIEHVWRLLSREVEKLTEVYKVQNKVQFFTLIKMAWRNVDNRDVIRIFNSFESRLNVVKEKRGSNANRY